MMEGLAGYRGRALEFLKNSKAGVGDVLELETDWGTVRGTLVPRYLYNDDAHVVLKLNNGYNIGIDVARLKSAKVKEKGEKPSFNPPPVPKSRGELPRVLILGTGGTIASRVDYRTGAVRPATTAEDLYALIPELSEIARVEPEILLSIYSENIEPSHWSRVAERVKKAVDDGVRGVVITMGTDTMGYTAAALGFALIGVPIPVVFVAAQRSSDRPSSDAVLNLIAGVSLAAEAEFSGVYVAMHLDESDGKIALHRCGRVRKNHTSRRDAFE
jgi:glutamyl-tRNA(Gln) amidotransferase subunit D